MSISDLSENSESEMSEHRKSESLKFILERKTPDVQFNDVQSNDAQSNDAQSNDARCSAFRDPSMNSAATIQKDFPRAQADALAYLKDLASRTLPQGYTIDYGGLSRQYVQESGGFATTFGFALIIIGATLLNVGNLL